MTTIEQDERIRSLEQFANAAPAGGNGGDGGSKLPAPAHVFSAPTERVFGAQQLQVKRDEELILKKLRVLAAAAGESFYYRIPVKKKVKNRETGKDEWVTDYIEGPTIKCANAVSRLFGNCDTDLRVFDTGTHWIIYARFIDLETGYSLVRPFQQRKGQGSIRGDSGRQEDIAFQIGVSKAIRNVTCNALEFFTSFAADEAKHSIIEKVGKKLDYYRERVAERLNEMNIAVTRVERVRGRAIKDWLATDVAKTIAELQGINDGMATADETYPAPEGETIDPKTGEVLDKFAGSEGGASSGPAATETQGGNAKGNGGGHQKSADSDDNGADETVEDNSDTQRSPPPTRSDGAAVSDAGVAPNASASTNSGPTNDQEYAAYADTWIDGSTSFEECNARWSREKKLRSSCAISQESFDRLEAKKKAKVAALKGK